MPRCLELQLELSITAILPIVFVHNARYANNTKGILKPGSDVVMLRVIVQYYNPGG